MWDQYNLTNLLHCIHFDNFLKILSTKSIALPEQDLYLTILPGHVRKYGFIKDCDFAGSSGIGLTAQPFSLVISNFDFVSNYSSKINFIIRLQNLPLQLISVF